MAKGVLQAVLADFAAAFPGLGGGGGGCRSAGHLAREGDAFQAFLGGAAVRPRGLRTAFRDDDADGEEQSPLGNVSDEQMEQMEANPDDIEDIANGKPPHSHDAPSSDPNFVPVPGGPQQPPRLPGGYAASTFGLSAGSEPAALFRDDDASRSQEAAAPVEEVIKVPREWSIKCKHPFLRFARKSQWLDDSDILCPNWISKPFPIDKENFVEGKPPWFHPSFRFKVPVHRVRLRLGPEGEEPYWDVIYSGPPGADDMVTNSAVPVGGKKMQFQYFESPITPDRRWTLRITEASKVRPPRFDELLTLKVAPEVPVEKGPEHLPRPNTLVAKGTPNGALFPQDEYYVPEDVDFETGEKLKSFL